MPCIHLRLHPARALGVTSTIHQLRLRARIHTLKARRAEDRDRLRWPTLACSSKRGKSRNGLTCTCMLAAEYLCGLEHCLWNAFEILQKRALRKDVNTGKEGAGSGLDAGCEVTLVTPPQSQASFLALQSSGNSAAWRKVFSKRASQSAIRMSPTQKRNSCPVCAVALVRWQAKRR